ncbi:MAG: cbb3-type cytochrome oxidase assembly protein CcoS [Polyangiaceae bacterium]
MSVLYIVFPVAIVIALLFVLAFAWASRRGQFDDLETPAVRILLDDEPRPRRAADPARKNGA